MNPWTRIDLYCERTDWSFWAEPLNAFTNVAFIVAAVLILSRSRGDRGQAPWDALLLAALAVLVGVGSFLFHTFATVWGRWLDLGFIALFIYVFLARSLVRVAGLGWRGALVGLLFYFGFERGALALLPRDALGGSILYLPALLGLAGLALVAWRRHRPHARLATAAGIFLAAIVVRTLDQPLCDAWPAGTHFIWHLLVAWVLYLAATAALELRGATAANRG